MNAPFLSRLGSLIARVLRRFKAPQLADSSEAEQRSHTPPVEGSNPSPPTKPQAYQPAPGYARNPLRAFRNIPCPCGSNKKAKRCHGAQVYIPEAEVKLAREYLRRLSAVGFIEVRLGDIA